MSRERAEMALYEPGPKKRRVFRRLSVAACAGSRPAASYYDIKLEIIAETMVNSFCNNHVDFLTLVNYFVAVGHCMSKEAQTKSAERILKHVLGVDDVSEYHVKRCDTLAHYLSVAKIVDDNARTCRVIAMDFQKLISNGVPEPYRCDLFRYLLFSNWKEGRDAANKKFMLQLEEKAPVCTDEENADYERRWREQVSEGWRNRDAGLRKRAAARVCKFCRIHNLDAVSDICMRIARVNGVQPKDFLDVLRSAQSYDDRFASIGYHFGSEIDFADHIDFFSWLFCLPDETSELAVAPSLSSLLYLTACRLKTKDGATKELLDTTLKTAHCFIIFEEEFDSHDIQYPAFLRSTSLPKSTDEAARDAIRTPEFFPVMYMMEDVRSVCKTDEHRAFYRKLYALVYPRYGSRTDTYTKWISLGNDGRKRMDCYEKITFENYYDYREFLKNPNEYIYQHGIADDLRECTYQGETSLFEQCDEDWDRNL
jgi:hypothetical protein